MADVAKLLKKHKRVGLDTSFFIHHFSGSATYASVTPVVLKAVQSGSHSGITTLITVAEILIRPLQEKNTFLARHYREFFRSYPGLDVLALDWPVVDFAAHVRARYGLKLPDALQMAGALLGGATVFFTSDKGFLKVREIEVRII